MLRMIKSSPFTISSKVFTLSGKYGFLDENGEIKIVEYSANNSTGFQSDLELEQVNALTEVEAAPQQVNCSLSLRTSSSHLMKTSPTIKTNSDEALA